MAISMQDCTSIRGVPWRWLGWGAATLLLSLPLVTSAPWTPSDYVFMGVLFAIVGLAFELIFRKPTGVAYRLGAALAVVTGFLTVWVNAAVGMIGDGPYDLLFGGVLLVAFLGAIVARFRPAGLAGAMMAAAILQAVLSVAGLSADPRGGLFSLVFAAPWLLAAALFWYAGRNPSPAA